MIVRALTRRLCKQILKRKSYPTLKFMCFAAFLLIFFVIVLFRTSDMFKPKHRMFLFCSISDNEERYRAFTFEHDVDLSVIVIVYNRAESLQRLLESLNNAQFYGDNIALHVWIDRSQNGTIDSSTYKVARDFTFTHGQYYVHNQTCHVGIYGQWIGAWYPRNSSSEIAVILEDDLTVSPYFYKWLKVVHNKFDNRPDINGYSLQGVSIKHGIDQDGFLDVNKTHKAFLYPILGTWGFSPNNRNWRAFSDWYMMVRGDPSFQPYVEGIHPSVWYQEQLEKGQQDRMWSMWFIYYAWMHKEYTMYSNFKDHQGLTINWKEPGLHYSKSDDVTKPDPLLLDWKSEYEDLPDNPVIVDVNGNEMIPKS
ncbi:hypothetical protein ACJMK2_024615 [Sinanodonta woodiana]|uniref:Uncharacterized protein n=1 Tax=Sinanodonta woodiana TaxID=1069815 RepID=A0ABD3XDX3_SINWO